VKDPVRRGKFDETLFRAFRAAKGIERRRLLDQLLWENEPLVKLIVDQLCGRGESKKRNGIRHLGGCQGFRDIPWEDAMQAGLIAMQKALEQFDPAKGRIAGYLKLKARHELQRIVYYGGQTIRVPRGQDAQSPDVALIGDEQILDRLSGGEEDLLGGLEITAQDVAEWEESGEWPESLEELRASRAPAIAEDTRTAIERFVDTKLAFRPAARLAQVTLDAVRTRFAMQTGDMVSRSALAKALLERPKVREMTVRVRWSPKPVWGWGGVALQPASTQAA
jgi:DNA-directed RNA polymerase specialized sigma subunit